MSDRITALPVQVLRSDGADVPDSFRKLQVGAAVPGGVPSVDDVRFTGITMRLRRGPSRRDEPARSAARRRSALGLRGQVLIAVIAAVAGSVATLTLPGLYRDILGTGPAFSVTSRYAWVPEDAILFAFRDRLTANQRARVLALHFENASTVLSDMGGVRFGEPVWRGPSTESSTRVELVVERHGASTATIVGMHAVIIRRASPLAGSDVVIGPEGDGKVSSVAIDLDSPEPIARIQGAHESLGRSYFLSRRVTVAQDDPATFVVQAYTHRHSYEWVLAIDLIVDGQFKELYASDRGRPFRSTARAQAYGMTYRFNPTIQRFQRTRA